MTYELIDINDPETVIQRWGSLPGRVDFGDGTTISPVSVGDKSGDLLVVEVKRVDDRLSEFHARSGEMVALVGSVKTVTAIYVDQTDDQISVDYRQLVNRERDRRREMPKAVTLSTGRSFSLDMGGTSRANISDASQAAREKIIAGITTSIVFTDADDVDQTLTNEEMIEAALQVALGVFAIHAAARRLKMTRPFIRDFDDDAHWA